MINNEFILKSNLKELNQKSSKNNNDKFNLERNFKKVLNEKSENFNEIDNSRESDLNNKIENSKNIINKDIDETNIDEIKKNEINNKESELVNEITLEEVVKEVVKIINEQENFQGNNIDNEAMEELVALLNQIINLPQIKNLLPVKLEDPMFISNIGNDMNVETGNINNSQNTFNLVNSILETLDSKNINNLLSEEQLNGFKSALEVLANNFFKEDMSQESSLINNSLMKSEVVNEVKLENKNLKDTKELDGNDTSFKIVDDSNNDEVKDILTELKSKIDTNKVNENKVEISTYGTKTEFETHIKEEDKVLAKILGESESVVLNKQNTFISRLNVKTTEIIKEPMTINKETMDADIIKNVKFMMKNAVSELKVKIYPKELGEMTIKLLSEEGILKADIKATSKETYNLLNSNLNDIKKTLEQQNIKIHEVNISLYSDDTTYYGGENSREEMFKNNENRQDKNSSNKSGYLIDDLESNENLNADNSIDQLV